MFINLLKGIDHAHFVTWEKLQLQKFQGSSDWLCIKSMELSTGLALQMQAQKEIVEFGKDMYMLDCTTWTTPELQVVAFEDDWEEVKELEDMIIIKMKEWMMMAMMMMLMILMLMILMVMEMEIPFQRS
jgi:hypothetical protein